MTVKSSSSSSSDVKSLSPASSEEYVGNRFWMCLFNRFWAFNECAFFKWNYTIKRKLTKFFTSCCCCETAVDVVIGQFRCWIVTLSSRRRFTLLLWSKSLTLHKPGIWFTSKHIHFKISKFDLSFWCSEKIVTSTKNPPPKQWLSAGAPEKNSDDSPNRFRFLSMVMMDTPPENLTTTNELSFHHLTLRGSHFSSCFKNCFFRFLNWK